MQEININYPQKIIDVLYVESEFKQDKVFEQLTIVFEHQKIDIYSINDTDEIEIVASNICNYRVTPNQNSYFGRFIGQTIFTTWKCINSQGYFDLFILGIESIKPTICILSEGSSLKLLDIK